jgi:DNA-binding GntR family transcriptional regulator
MDNDAIGTLAVSERQMLSHSVYEALRKHIFDQRIAPSAKLNIDALARDLAVSQTPVREALARLEAEGLVSKEPLRGYTVKPLLDDAELAQLFEARLILEPQAARLAATRASEAHIAELERLDVLLRQPSAGASYSEIKTFAGNDAAFHAILAEATGNEYLRAAILRLQSHLHLSRRYFHRGIADAFQALPEDHDILDALRRRDASAAERSMREHITRSQARYQKLLAIEP